MKFIFPKTKEEAEESAKLLVQQLKEEVGGDWKIRVHFNSWWCYSAILGTMSVSERIYESQNEWEPLHKVVYNLSFGDKCHSGTPVIWYSEDLYNSEELKDLIFKSLDYAQEQISYYQKAIDNQKELLG